MMVDAIGQAATTKNSAASLSTDQFLQLFAAQLQYQDPTEPMDNAALMQQMSQITQLQMMDDLSSGMKNILENNQLLQASGLIGRMVEYTNDAGSLAQGVVTDVRVNKNGVAMLGLHNNAQIDMSTISRVM